MKKKGLIISTVVMVVVLIASLTTATYAWFTTTASTSVQSINISAASGADVKIGVVSSQLGMKASATQDDFLSGTVTISSTGASGGENCLGSNLETGLQLDTISMATGMGTPNVTTYTADGTVNNTAGHFYKDGDDYLPCPAASAPATTYTATNSGAANKLVPSAIVGSIVKAEGTTTKNASNVITGSEVTPASVVAAVANTDYLHFTLGFAASVENITSITLNLFVNPLDTKTTIGITSALHFDYKVDSEDWVDGDDGDVYGSSTYQTLKSDINTASTVGTELGTSDSAALNAGWKKVSIDITPSSTAFTVNTEIHQIEFYIYYDGADSDCLTEALGSSCEVLFFVTNVKAS